MGLGIGLGSKPIHYFNALHKLINSISPKILSNKNNIKKTEINFKKLKGNIFLLMNLNCRELLYVVSDYHHVFFLM